MAQKKRFLQGANCSNCDNSAGVNQNLKRCKQCARFDGFPGWNPRTGIKIKEGLIYTPSGVYPLIEVCQAIQE